MLVILDFSPCGYVSLHFAYDMIHYRDAKVRDPAGREIFRESGMRGRKAPSSEGAKRPSGYPPSHERDFFVFSTRKSCISLHFLNQIDSPIAILGGFLAVSV